LSEEKQPGLTLKLSSAEFVDGFVLMRDAVVAAGGDEWSGGAAIAYTDPARYLETIRSWSEGKNLPPNWCPADCYLIFSGDEVVGQVDIRHPLTEFLTQYGGNIGYNVHPAYRNRGIATWALRTALELLAAKGASEALLTCAHDNGASIRIIEKCGGRRISDSARRRYIIPIDNWPRLSGPRVILEPLVAAHADELFVRLSDPRALLYIDNVPPSTVAGLRERYRRLESRRSPDGSEEWLNWAVMLDGHAIGFVEATVRAGGRIAIAYGLGFNYWSHGFGTEAVRTMIDFLKTRYPGARFEATVDERNVASRRLLERIGLQITDRSDPRNVRLEGLD
jgi:[ribosomal protein S5]-alanine N-acetyltransferase